VFIYFVQTKRQAPTPDDVAPISYAMHAGAMRYAASTAGPPDGKAGLLIARESVPAAHMQSPGDPGTWWRVAEGVYVKQVDAADPRQLMRPPSDCLPGHVTQLEDGNTWVIPRAVQWTDTDAFALALPRYDVLGDDGEWRPGSVISRHARLWELAQQVKDTPPGGDRYAIEMDAAVAAVSANYYIGASEASLLQLLSRDARQRVFDCLFDGPGLRLLMQDAAAAEDRTPDAVKKKRSLADVPALV